MDDRAPNLAVLLAWGMLNTLFPLTLGILALASFVLRDSGRLNELTGTLFGLVPADTAQTLRRILAQTQENAGAAGIISLLLLLFSGSNFFATMQMVFNLAYHVPDRNVVAQRAMAVVMLLFVTALLLVSTTAYGLGTLVGALAITAPIGAVLARVIGWSISIVSALVMFLLLFKTLPNKPQRWSHSLPGAIIAAALFFVILQVFPLYVAIFGKSFAAYAAFGIFFVLMLWLFLLGLVLVLGVELNAYFEAPGRSSALAATAARAEKGQVRLRWRPGAVQALAIASARTADREANADQSLSSTSLPLHNASTKSARFGAGNSLIGLVGLIVAAFLLRTYWLGGQPVSARR
ncbi:MAG: YihY/virulence factor BrkB family protein [Chloroflexi bacterium]|nr:YihY/virulence factor BrkB family protein [Chloroflexota bacterium]